MMTSDGAGPHGGQNQDFDINLAPIIDCFTVLITFLLASASFLAIGIFDTSVAVPGASSDKTATVSVRVDVELLPNLEIYFKLSGAPPVKGKGQTGGNYTKKLAAIGGKWNTKQLLEEIAAVQTKFPGTTSMVLTAGDDIEYEHVVKIMETMRTKVPNILLGGF